MKKEPEIRNTNEAKQAVATLNQEYVWYHPASNEVVLLWEKPMNGYEAFPHDLDVSGSTILTDLYYIGEV